MLYAAALKSPIAPAAAAPILIRAATGANGGILGRLQTALPAPASQNVTFYYVTSCNPVARSRRPASSAPRPWLWTRPREQHSSRSTSTNMPTVAFCDRDGLGRFATHDVRVRATASRSHRTTTPGRTRSTSGEYNGNVAATPAHWAIPSTSPASRGGTSSRSRPERRLTVDLTGLPANYDAALFTDITQAYTALTKPSDLTKLSANFAGAGVLRPGVLGSGVPGSGVLARRVQRPGVLCAGILGGRIQRARHSRPRRSAVRPSPPRHSQGRRSRLRRSVVRRSRVRRSLVRPSPRRRSRVRRSRVRRSAARRSAARRFRPRRSPAPRSTA